MILDNMNVLVVGIARSGISTIKELSSRGSNVYINDIKSKDQFKDIYEEIAQFITGEELGGHPQNLDSYDMMVVSPGVPTDLAFISKFKEMNKPVIGELELAYRLSKGKFVAITGTNGKTTTTALMGEIMKNANIHSFVVGNIGLPAISVASKTRPDTVLITEVSSFQLETTSEFRPYISLILNITPDHLNRHKTMENYIDAKCNIFDKQREDDFVVLNYDNELTKDLASRTKSKVVFFSRQTVLDEGVYVESDKVYISLYGKKRYFCDTDIIRIKGKHNLENALAAITMSAILKVEDEIIIKTLKEFGGVKHRGELSEQKSGISFFNNSKATNPDAAINAIDAMTSETILIAGGMDKGSDFTDMIISMKSKVKSLVLLGETKEIIKKQALENGFEDIHLVESMSEAVRKAYELANPGDSVLLAPACASWDMYDNFEVRGDDFNQNVKDI